jgi:hypothetical protein
MTPTFKLKRPQLKKKYQVGPPGAGAGFMQLGPGLRVQAGAAGSRAAARAVQASRQPARSPWPAPALHLCPHTHRPPSPTPVPLPPQPPFPPYRPRSTRCTLTWQRRPAGLTRRGCCERRPVARSRRGARPATLLASSSLALVATQPMLPARTSLPHCCWLWPPAPQTPRLSAALGFCVWTAHCARSPPLCPLANPCRARAGRRRGGSGHRAAAVLSRACPRAFRLHGSRRLLPSTPCPVPSVREFVGTPGPGFTHGARPAAALPRARPPPPPGAVAAAQPRMSSSRWSSSAASSAASSASWSNSVKPRAFT